MQNRNNQKRSLVGAVYLGTGVMIGAGIFVHMGMEMVEMLH